ncbi:flagellar biosynthetic protein FlhB [Burkholderia diffusa]|uniref:Flagellar biosynthetic protein FlhB n=1 Tax=Burkholderia diffusa TaxID=488732 RepID=A0AAW3P6X0_9BURK|nr:flagellar type III secretion system protein FlhB [Burkholderia diffusa]KVH43242.1 flagellar biosynthetic protein FlhB [Burkholderia diffusa]KVN02963.1 flagellar biosynthetic protein FlhB [Burkholderia diffusa]KWF41363.1 flagellar biosynthetic protein FlhB [Burkholderia diffusa]KWF44189.1 flagellar biosynthetic protein FlhB [Burkholderia diffusa]KWF45097.1 flagellar biosynthetic protein FlhB [Burkholderia diffusa]
MANQDSGSKTEHATPQKLRQARKQGQIARSRDLATALGVLISLRVFMLLAPSWLRDFRLLFMIDLADMSADGALANVWSIVLPASLMLFVKMVVPFFIVPLCIIVGSLIPGGWIFSSSNFKPKLSRMNPIANLGRLVSARHYGTFALSVGKALTIIAVLAYISCTTMVDFLELQSMSLPAALARGATLLTDGALALAAVMLVFALIDVPFQRFVFMRGQRMTKQEVKEEHKTTEGRPEVRGRIRQLQRQAAQRALANSVPGADVVIANPTHYAVALKYDTGRADAPFVVAKGIDDMAIAIRQLAEAHGVEVLTLPPLARAIYHTSQVNQQIPAALYRAVAQVLTYVLQLKAFQQGRRDLRPERPIDIPVPEPLAKAQTS